MDDLVPTQGLPGSGILEHLPRDHSFDEDVPGRSRGVQARLAMSVGGSSVASQGSFPQTVGEQVDEGPVPCVFCPENFGIQSGDGHEKTTK